MVVDYCQSDAGEQIHDGFIANVVHVLCKIRG
jgi:hypothetical protein